MDHYHLLKVLAVVSILQVWWVAVWGVCYMGINYLTKHTVLTEFWVYLLILIGVYFVLFANPKLVRHIVAMGGDGDV